MEKIIDGIKVTVIRKKIKNMYIRVANDYGAIVTAPLFVSERTIERFFFDNIKNVKRANIGVTLRLTKCHWRVKSELSREGHFFFKELIQLGVPSVAQWV